MNYVIDVLIIILLFGLYAIIHSYLASIKVKEWFKKNFGDLIASCAPEKVRADPRVQDVYLGGKV